jgi:pimeloyl-ACP methyl ester carboxylesterase
VLKRSLVFIICLLWLGTVQGEEVKLFHNGLTLNANLVKTGEWPRGPVVLMLHGTLAHGRMEIMSGLQGMFRERGISSLSINLSLGLDDRASEMYDCPVTHRHRHLDAVAEAAAWYRWLKGQGAENIALLGHSRGGNQMARFAASLEESEVQAVFLVAPSTWNEAAAADGYEKRYGKTLMPMLERARQLVAAGKGAQLLQPVGFIYCPEAAASADAFVSYYEPDDRMHTPNLLSAIRSPVVVFAGSEDRVVANLAESVEPMADGERLWFEVVEGADHFFRDLYSEDLADRVAAALGVE